MILTLHRYRFIIYRGRDAIVDDFGWSFDFPESSRTVSDICTTVKMPHDTISVKTPPLANVVERRILEKGIERKIRVLSFHAEPWGIDACAVYWLACNGARGFSIAEGGK